MTERPRFFFALLGMAALAVWASAHKAGDPTGDELEMSRVFVDDYKTLRSFHHGPGPCLRYFVTAEHEEDHERAKALVSELSGIGVHEVPFDLFLHWGQSWDDQFHSKQDVLEYLSEWLEHEDPLIRFQAQVRAMGEAVKNRIGRVRLERNAKRILALYDETQREQLREIWRRYPLEASTFRYLVAIRRQGGVILPSPDLWRR